MDPYERERLDRINRDAELEKAPDDPQRPVDARSTRPLLAMTLAALAAIVIVLGIMWVNNTRYDGASGKPVAQQQQPKQ